MEQNEGACDCLLSTNSKFMATLDDRDIEVQIINFGSPDINGIVYGWVEFNLGTDEFLNSLD